MRLIALGPPEAEWRIQSPDRPAASSCLSSSKAVTSFLFLISDNSRTPSTSLSFHHRRRPLHPVERNCNGEYHDLSRAVPPSQGGIGGARPAATLVRAMRLLDSVDECAPRPQPGCAALAVYPEPLTILCLPCCCRRPITTLASQCSY